MFWKHYIRNDKNWASLSKNVCALRHVKMIVCWIVALEHWCVRISAKVFYPCIHIFPWNFNCIVCLFVVWVWFIVWVTLSCNDNVAANHVFTALTLLHKAVWKFKKTSRGAWVCNVVLAIVSVTALVLQLITFIIIFVFIFAFVKDDDILLAHLWKRTANVDKPARLIIKLLFQFDSDSLFVKHNEIINK